MGGQHSDRGLSTSGYVFMLCGGPISWASKRQKSVALSSTEAEYMSQALAIQEALWLSLFLAELDIRLEQDSSFRFDQSPVSIYADNQGAIALAKNPEFHARTKHIDIKYHFIRQEVDAGTCQLVYTPTTQQAADGLTKPLGKIAFQRFVTCLGMKCPPVS